MRTRQGPGLQRVAEIRPGQEQAQAGKGSLSGRRAGEVGQRFPQFPPDARIDRDAGALEQRGGPLERKTALRLAVDAAKRLERQTLRTCRRDQ